MPRAPRSLSSSGFYHLIARGIDKSVMFYDDVDYLYFKKLLKEIAEAESADVCCYCLMNNHFHLLVKMNSMEYPSNFMKRIQIRYAYYFNHKYERSGYVFQDRFKSECIEDEKYFLTVFRYICNNPVKASVVDNVFDYRWSTARELLVDGSDFSALYHVFSIMNKDELVKFLTESIDDKCADISEDSRCITDATAIKKFEQYYKQYRISDVKSLAGNYKTEAIRFLFSINCSERQISRITGISRGTLRRLSVRNVVDNMKETSVWEKYHQDVSSSTIAKSSWDGDYDTWKFVPNKDYAEFYTARYKQLHHGDGSCGTIEFIKELEVQKDG